MESAIARIKHDVDGFRGMTIAGMERHETHGYVAFGRSLKADDGRYIPPKTVVITKRPVEGDEQLTVLEARYAGYLPCLTTGDPPVTTCTYAWEGEEFLAYPPLGSKAIDFAGDEQVPADDVHPPDDDDPPKFDSVFHRVHREHQVWIIDEKGGSIIQQFRIVGFSGFPDTITAKTWDGMTLGTEIIQIAKPFTLRRKPFEGFIWNDITYSFQSNIDRTANKTIPGNPPREQTERQVIVPAYTVDQTIYAAKEVVGGVGATYDDDDGVAQNAKWLDLNVDGRSWAKKA